MVNKNHRFKFIQILSIKTISPCFLTTINRKTPIYEDLRVNLRVNFALNMHREQKMCKHDVSSFLYSIIYDSSEIVIRFGGKFP